MIRQRNIDPNSGVGKLYLQHPAVAAVADEGHLGFFVFPNVEKVEISGVWFHGTLSAGDNMTVEIRGNYANQASDPTLYSKGATQFTTTIAKTLTSAEHIRQLYPAGEKIIRPNVNTGDVIISAFAIIVGAATFSGRVGLIVRVFDSDVDL